MLLSRRDYGGSIQDSSGTTGSDSGFVVNCCGGEGLDRKVCPFVTNLVMVSNDETTLATLESMLSLK